MDEQPRAIQSARAIIGDDVHFRAAIASEIATLQSQGNVAADWSGVRVCTSGSVIPFVHRCVFSGVVRLGPFGVSVRAADGITELPSGVYGSTLCDCAVVDGALVQDTR
jgi:hypothetical protein